MHFWWPNSYRHPHLIGCLKASTSKGFFQLRKQVVVARCQIWRVWWMIKNLPLDLDLPDLSFVDQNEDEHCHEATTAFVSIHQDVSL